MVRAAVLVFSMTAVGALASGCSGAGGGVQVGGAGDAGGQDATMISVDSGRSSGSGRSHASSSSFRLSLAIVVEPWLEHGAELGVKYGVVLGFELGLDLWVRERQQLQCDLGGVQPQRNAVLGQRRSDVRQQRSVGDARGLRRKPDVCARGVCGSVRSEPDAVLGQRRPDL